MLSLALLRGQTQQEKYSQQRLYLQWWFAIQGTPKLPNGVQWANIWCQNSSRPCSILSCYKFWHFWRLQDIFGLLQRGLWFPLMIMICSDKMPIVWFQQDPHQTALLSSVCNARRPPQLGFWQRYGWQHIPYPLTLEYLFLDRPTNRDTIQATSSKALDWMSMTLGPLI